MRYIEGGVVISCTVGRNVTFCVVQISLISVLKNIPHDLVRAFSYNSSWANASSSFAL